MSNESGLFILDEVSKKKQYPPLIYPEVEAELLSPGNIYWIKTSGDQILIAPFGSVLNHEQIRKFINSKANIVIDMMVNHTVTREGILALNKLKQSKNIEQYNVAREKILIWATKFLYADFVNGSFVDLMNVFYSSFYSLDKKVEEILLEMSRIDFQRSLLMGSFSVIFALALGLHDVRYLQDLYHLHFILDHSLNLKGMSFTLREAAEKERTKSGEGVSHLLINKEEGPELDKFKKHTTEGELLAKRVFSKLFHSNDVFSLISRHHEKINGKGFPKGLNINELSEIEQIIILSNHLFSYDELYFEKSDAVEFLKKIVTKHFPNKNEIVTDDFLTSVEQIFSRMLTIVNEHKAVGA